MNSAVELMQRVNSRRIISGSWHQRDNTKEVMYIPQQTASG